MTYIAFTFICACCRVEYSTWAGMIVTQYGRIPGSMLANGVHFNGQPSASGGGQQGGSPQRQSAALDELQRYYGTGDTASEPEDFRPGARVCACMRACVTCVTHSLYIGFRSCLLHLAHQPMTYVLHCNVLSVVTSI